MFCAISQVSATDSVDNLTSTDDSVEAVSVEESDVELDGDSSSEAIGVCEEERLSQDPLTFTDLQTKINSASYVELNSDYRYVDGDGSTLKEGIRINKDVYIEGNGHKIYANAARVFVVGEGSTLMINNVTFIGEYENTIFTEGGAIFNDGVLSLNNSVFMGCRVAYQGGAIFCSDVTDLNIENCEFYDNHADGDNNRPGNGGAIASYGYVYISDSIFNNCTADFGGALATFKESKIYDSIFGQEDSFGKGNIAFSCGGAIFNCDETDDDNVQPVCYAINCDFNHNVAYYAGGALFNVIAINSHFGDNNYAVEDDDGVCYGHNMFLGLNYYCDEDDSDSENYCDTIMSTGFTFSAVSLIVTPSDKAFKVRITSTPDGEPVQGLDVYMEVDNGVRISTDLYVDEDNWVYNSTDSDGIARFPLTGLSEGDHNIEVGLWSYYLDYPFEKFKVHIGLIASSVSGTPIYFNQGGSGATVLSLTGATVARQNVYVIGQPAANIQIRGNVISVSNLPAGNYLLSVTTTPNYGYSASSCMIPITVNRVYTPAVVHPSSDSSGTSKKVVKFSVKKEFGNNHKCTGLFITPKVNGKAVKGLTFKLLIYTNGKVVKTITLKSIKSIYGHKKCAFFSTNALSKGTHKVKITINTKKYTGSKITSIQVKKRGTFTNKNGYSKGK